MTASSVFGQSIDAFWTDNSDGDWLSPSNWSSDPLAPVNPDDRATVDRPGLYTITLNQNLAISDLWFDAADATLTGSGSLSLNYLGWQNGTMSGEGTTSTGWLDVYGDMTLVGRTLEVREGMYWHSGNIVASEGATLRVGIPDWWTSVNLQGSGSFGNAAKDARVQVLEQASLFYTGSTTHEFRVDAAFDNAGYVSVGGRNTLVLSGGGHSTGTFTTQSHGQIEFAGGHHLIEGTALEAGQYILSDGTLEIQSDSNPWTSDSTSLQITGGLLTGSAALSAAYLTWQGGSMSGDGSTAVNQLEMQGNTTLIGRTLEVSQRLEWQSGSSILASEGATLRLGNPDAWVSIVDLRGSGSFGNAAKDARVQVLEHTNLHYHEATGSTHAFHVDAAFDNAGEVYVYRNNTLVLSGGGHSTGRFNLYANGWDDPGAARVEFAGGHHVLEGVELDGARGQYVLSDGTLEIRGTVTGGNNFQMLGGAITGAGTLALGQLDWRQGTISAHEWSAGQVWVGGDVEMVGPTQFWTDGLQFSTDASLDRLRLSILDGVDFQFRGSAVTLHSDSGVPAEVLIEGAGSIFQAPSVSIGINSLDPTVTGRLTVGEGGVVETQSFTVHDTGRLHLTGGTVKAAYGITMYGLLAGEGTIEGNLINEGSIQPGQSPGTLTIEGDFTQNALGQLVIEIASLMSGSFDQLLVSGDAILGGELEVILLEGAYFMQGDTFEILTATSIAGSFDSVILPTDEWGQSIFAFVQDGNHLTLTALQTVPEPGTLALLGLGLIALHRRRRIA
ncbi:PEP-CTERM sorting domain-containing protein [Phycisphaerales bacterium AB-hyl4]|uniref:PEP-CTERM sorting domain-containing protein n=1 Tax=Natronomicrosphaera hydrolytica TaxID=3242702 RepID=A0ABV4U070_9BACT